MKEVVILSGKGGTGKTSIVGSFAAIAHDKVMADCDVDAADLHLLLKPITTETHQFRNGQVAVIDKSICTECGLCRDLCRFEAISANTVDPVACEGCGFCFHLCPIGAISMRECQAGEWFISDTRHGPMVHARLGIAQENSGKLVALVRQQARNLAQENGLEYIIVDGPPGIGCPVISSLSGVNLALIITEPTLSGIHDMERILGVCEHFKVPAMVCVNKCDVNEENTRTILEYCKARGVTAETLIPFDNIFTEAMVRGKSVVEYGEGRVTSKIKNMWQKVLSKLNEVPATSP
ncbi:Cobyrinic acid ac-diamide synthase [Dehalogenimonas lykanthroporepellens BL-DC-9]|nr:Cobyrinic acid ac-diamide synthase [Dehalogenimonas lykanthroporepellens BL-DC-9]